MNKRGFSLLEVLVACGILALLVLLLAQMANSASAIWSGGHARSERRQSARAFLDFISRELRGAALPVNKELMAGRGDLQMVINPASVPERFRNAHSIFWQAPIATDVSEGDMAEIGYFVRWIGHRAALCRLFLNPVDSRILLGGGATRQRVYQYSGNWVNAQVLDAACPADEANGYRGLFAENVIAFWARPLDAAGKLIFNVGENGFDSNIASSSGVAPDLPASVEVSFIVLDSNTAARLAERSDASSVVGEIQSLAREAGKPGAGKSPASTFLDDLNQRNELQFLLRGASVFQILVDLDNAPSS